MRYPENQVIQQQRDLGQTSKPVGRLRYLVHDCVYDVRHIIGYFRLYRVENTSVPKYDGFSHKISC